MRKVTERQTKASNQGGSWGAETLTTVGGQTYEISTMKTSRGLLNSSAMKVEAGKDDNASIMSFSSTDIFNRIQLASSKPIRATEKVVKAQHFEAIAIFDDKVKSGEIETVEKVNPEIGTILFLDGYGKTKGSAENKHIVYEIENSKRGINYKTVEVDTLKLEVKNHVRPYAEKFGIGTYFELDYKFEGSQDDINNLVIEAHQKLKADNEKLKAESILKAEERAQKIKEGRKLVNIPSWAKSIIVAEYYNNDSDSQTDYFSTSVSTRMFLAFSRTTRNNMQELRKAALNFEGTADFPERADNNPEKEYNEPVEFTSGHSYLPDYFLGSENWYGWKVNKNKYFPLNNEANKEKLYIAAAEGHYFVPQEEEKEIKEVSADGLQLVEYSEKAIAVIGETKPIKDILKSLGGRFNFRLSCGAGWIFPKSKEQEIRAALSL